jgi:hypothetical protein
MKPRGLLLLAVIAGLAMVTRREYPAIIRYVKMKRM